MARWAKASPWPRPRAEALLPLALLAGMAPAMAAGDAPAAMALLLASAGEPHVAGASGQDVYLEVTLNGMRRGLVHFGERAGTLWAAAATLRQLGFVLPAGTPDPLPLATLPGVQAQYDRARQSVAITAPLDLLDLPQTQLAMPGIQPNPVTSAPGALLNYDLYATRGTHGSTSLSAFNELRGFGPWGVLSNTMLSQVRHAGGSGGQGRSVRLDTRFTHSWQERMLTLRVGDTLTQGPAWARPTRIGGIQIGSDFALQPYNVTTPIPALLGSATLPSQVDLYINGIRQFNGQVPAGPFRLDTLPSISGAGNAQVVLTDAFGRSTTLNFSLYGTQRLLRAGLDSWSAELGWVRQGYGLKSFDYARDPMVSGSWRRGLSDAFTLETHAQATRGLVNLGVGGIGLLGTAGVLSGALAHARGTGGPGGSGGGTQLSLGYNWSDQRWNLGLAATRATRGFRDVAALHGAPLARTSGSATLGLNAGAAGSFSLSYLHQQYPGQAAARYVSAGWARPLGRAAFVSLSVNQDLVRRDQRSLFVGLSWSIDGRISASASVQHDPSGNRLATRASQSPPSEGGWGWSAAAQAGSGQGGAQGEVNYLGRFGRYTAGIDAWSRGSRYVYGSASGALVFMGGQPYAARQINDAFALVSTSGVPGVPVRLENRPIGVTDANGQLLVTPLNAWQNNKLAIDPMDLPADQRIQRVDAIVTPSDRAGARVDFAITPLRAALVTLVDAKGQPLPLGSRVGINDQPADAMVGYDGAVYLDTLAEHNRLRARTPQGACTVRFDHHKDERGAIPQIGPLACTPEVRP